MNNLEYYLKEQEKKWAEFKWTKFTGIFCETVFVVSSPDSSILEYLNNNEYPVVFSDYSGTIVLKY